MPSNRFQTLRSTEPDDPHAIAADAQRRSARLQQPTPGVVTRRHFPQLSGDKQPATRRSKRTLDDAQHAPHNKTNKPRTNKAKKRQRSQPVDPVQSPPPSTVATTPSARRATSPIGLLRLEDQLVIELQAALLKDDHAQMHHVRKWLFFNPIPQHLDRTEFAHWLHRLLEFHQLPPSKQLDCVAAAPAVPKQHASLISKIRERATHLGGHATTGLMELTQMLERTATSKHAELLSLVDDRLVQRKSLIRTLALSQHHSTPPPRHNRWEVIVSFLFKVRRYGIKPSSPLLRDFRQRLDAAINDPDYVPTIALTTEDTLSTKYQEFQRKMQVWRDRNPLPPSNPDYLCHSKQREASYVAWRLKLELYATSALLGQDTMASRVGPPVIAMDEQDSFTDTTLFWMFQNSPPPAGHAEHSLWQEQLDCILLEQHQLSSGRHHYTTPPPLTRDGRQRSTSPATAPRPPQIKALRRRAIRILRLLGPLPPLNDPLWRLLDRIHHQCSLEPQSQSVTEQVAELERMCDTPFNSWRLAPRGVSDSDVEPQRMSPPQQGHHSKKRKQQPPPTKRATKAPAKRATKARSRRVTTLARWLYLHPFDLLTDSKQVCWWRSELTRVLHDKEYAINSVFDDTSRHIPGITSPTLGLPRTTSDPRPQPSLSHTAGRLHHDLPGARTETFLSGARCHVGGCRTAVTFLPVQ